jgi:hypothetical protein
MNTGPSNCVIALTIVIGEFDNLWMIYPSVEGEAQAAHYAKSLAEGLVAQQLGRPRPSRKIE